MFTSLLVHKILVFFLGSTAYAIPTGLTQGTCAEIRNRVPGKLWVPGDRTYAEENIDYYNRGLSELMLACLVQPTSTQEVSEVAKILNRYKDVPFAMKSGGHDPNPGY